VQEVTRLEQGNADRYEARFGEDFHTGTGMSQWVIIEFVHGSQNHKITPGGTRCRLDTVTSSERLFLFFLIILHSSYIAVAPPASCIVDFSDPRPISAGDGVAILEL
jgi:hypothetical protein